MGFGGFKGGKGTEGGFVYGNKLYSLIKLVWGRSLLCPIFFELEPTWLTRLLSFAC